MSGGAFLAAAFNPFAFLTESGASSGRPFFISEHPAFVWNGGTLTLTLPTTPLVYGLPTVGGDIESDAGVRAGYIVRRDEIITFNLRFRESEWVNVQTFLNAVQAGIPFSWYPDALNDPGTFFRVQLEAPVVGQSYRAVPDANYPRVQLLTISVATASFIPGPAPQPEPPDFSAVPWLFWRRGVDRFQDDSALVPTVEDGDRIAVWKDQSGNNRHGTQDGGLFHNVAARPGVIGNAVQFGFINPPQGTWLTNSTPLIGLQQMEYMVSLKATHPVGAGGTDSGLFAINAATLYTNTDGHIWGGAGLPSSADLGLPPRSVTEWRVLGEAVASDERGYTARFNNNIIKEIAHGLFTYGLGGFGFTLGAISGYGVWDGQVRDLVVFDTILTDTQRLAWYNYMRGAVDDPPLLP